MYTVTLSGKEYELRCDLNVIEAIEERFGSIGAIYETIGSAKTVRWLVTEMINEAYAVRGSETRMTEREIGGQMLASDIIPAMQPVIDALNACVSPKKGKSGESAATDG